MSARSNRPGGRGRYGNRTGRTIRDKYDPMWRGDGTEMDEGAKGLSVLPVLGPLLGAAFREQARGKAIKGLTDQTNPKTGKPYTKDDFYALGGREYEPTTDLIVPIVSSVAGLLGLAGAAGAGSGAIGVGGNTLTAGGGVLAPGVVANTSTGALLGNLGAAGSAIGVGGNTLTAGGGVLAPGVVANTSTGALLGNLAPATTAATGSGTFSDIIEALAEAGIEYTKEPEGMTPRASGQHRRGPSRESRRSESVVSSSADGIGGLFNDKDESRAPEDDGYGIYEDTYPMRNMTSSRVPAYSPLGKPGSGYNARKKIPGQSQRRIRGI